ncbi:hypothetical protein BDR06DRAFT_985718 [Suillus hirtellus]|nr:hypothetical protein BDR06DRAFT_985718 [Suillus hirtellus]
MPVVLLNGYQPVDLELALKLLSISRQLRRSGAGTYVDYSSLQVCSKSTAAALGSRSSTFGRLASVSAVLDEAVSPTSRLGLTETCSHQRPRKSLFQISDLSTLALSDITSLLEHARSRSPDFGFSGYLLTPSARLQSFHAHLRSFNPRFNELSSAMIEVAAKEIARAVKQSFQGSQLIQYVDLPPKWRNNPFVLGGYRYVTSPYPPFIQKWLLIVMSLFAVHNETRGIYSFALLCLFSSVLWHTMAGCAHPQGMELCARIDYVGIGCTVTFLSLAFTATAPMAALAYLQSPAEMLAFVNPIWPSITSYLIGLRYSHWLDWCGGGSHAIWHIFIVIAPC